MTETCMGCMMVGGLAGALLMAVLVLALSVLLAEAAGGEDKEE